MKLICFGDSLTFGFGVHPSQRWTRIVEQETGWQVVNQGLNGDTATGILVRLQACLQSPAFRTPQEELPQVLIMGGSNDIFYSGSDLCARSSIGAMVHQLAAAGILPLVGIPLPVEPETAPACWGGAADFSAAAGLLAGYRAWLLRYCQAFGLHTVDFFADFFASDGSLRRELFLDGLHPTPAGHRLMADRLKGSLRELKR